MIENFECIGGEESKIHDAEETENSDRGGARPAELAAEDDHGEDIGAEEGAGDGDAVGRGQSVRSFEGENQQNHAGCEQEIDLRDVDLAFLGLAGVADFHAREKAELDALPGHGIGAGDDGLARDDGGQR